MDVANLVQIENLRFGLARNTITVFVHNFSLLTEANVSAWLWPLPVAEETVHVDLRFAEASVDVGVEMQNHSVPSALRMAQCQFTAPTLHARATNYWLFNKGLAWGGHLVEKHFASIVCPHIGAFVDTAQNFLNKDIPLVQFAPKLPPNLRDVHLQYKISELRIADGVLGTNIDVRWWRPSTTTTATTGHHGEGECTFIYLLQNYSRV